MLGFGSDSRTVVSLSCLASWLHYGATVAVGAAASFLVAGDRRYRSSEKKKVNGTNRKTAARNVVVQGMCVSIKSSDGLATVGFMSLKPAASSWELPLRELLCSGLLCDCLASSCCSGWMERSPGISSVRYI